MIAVRISNTSHVSVRLKPHKILYFIFSFHIEHFTSPISPYSSKTDDKKQTLRTVSNTGTYCSNDNVGTVCLVKHIPPSTSMHFATRVGTWRVARLYSEIALTRKPFAIGHMYIYNFFA
jgi:hypothetical protein